jgi:glycosyltransferase involved in cell wall biosynthesis
MHVAQISKADAFGGGASRVAEELCQVLRTNGYVAHHWASWSGKGYDYKTRYPLYGRFERQTRGAHYLVKKAGFPELLPFELLTLLRRGRVQNYDVVHFHDLSSAISPFTLSYLGKIKPVIWTLHDCSPFTGGCLYPMDCVRFKEGCGQCPQVGQWPIDSLIDGTATMYRIKKKLHASQRVITITPSRWMSEMAFSSGLFLEKPTVIPNGVDIDLYQAADKTYVRNTLGLPQNRRIILLSAGNILDERKGTRFALEALSQIEDLKPFLLAVGNVDESARKWLNQFDYHATGYIGEPEKLALVYAAADIFLFCSLADNQPLVILETMATGTPMIGFATGGIPEMIEQDKTGFLVPQRDVNALVAALRHAFDGQKHFNWGREARKKAISDFSFKRLLENHVRIYEQAITQKDKGWLK